MCPCVVKCSVVFLIFSVVSSTSTIDRTKDSNSGIITTRNTDVIEPSSFVAGGHTDDQFREFPSIPDPTNHYNFDKRWTVSYGPKIEPRLLFPVFSAPRPRPNNGLPTKGYGPPKAPPISYPAARPPQPVYRPQARPPQSYGPPKPVGYPVSSNHQNIQEVYITYPPATAASHGSYAPASGYPSASTGSIGSSSNYLPPPLPEPQQSTSKPNYGLPISFPNPNYETPSTYPAPVTNKPPTDYNYATSTPSPYINPSYPLPTGQTNYPGYPSSQINSIGSGSYNPSPSSGYPVPSAAGSYKPSSYKPPNHPSLSLGSYNQAVTPPPIFVFIPKPGHFNSDYQKPGNYQHKPSGIYPAPVHHFPAARPPTVTGSQTQYYPAPQNIKPLKPSGVYPPAKAPSTAYGLPKPQRPNHDYSSNAQASTSYRTSQEPYHTNIQANYNEKDDIYKTRQPLENSYNQVESKPVQFSASSQPNLFQRGNSHIAAAQHVSQLSFNGNKSLPIGAESSQIVTVTDHLSNYRGNFQVPHSTNNKIPTNNDCGGSWVVLEHPIGEYADPTKVQVEPIFPPFGNSITSGYRPNGQLFRSPEGPGVSFVTFPPGINELPVSHPSRGKPDFANVFIFSTTPSPNPGDLSVNTDGTWRKPNSLNLLPSFSSSRPIASAEISQPVSNVITASSPSVSTSIQTLASTENSVVFNTFGNLHDSNGINFQSADKSPSPFLADILPVFVNDDDHVNKGGKNIASSSAVDNDVNSDSQPISSSVDDAESLIRLLRSANLRALSALISQADIATLIQEKEYTLMAPSNAAFKQVSSSQRQRWNNRPDMLREMLLHHLIPGHLNSSSFQNEATPVTLAGSRRLRINIYNDTDTRDTVTTANGARILTPDLYIGNLLVHVVDRVLMPSNSASQTILDILNDGGLQASLMGPSLTRVLSSDSSSLTVFVPTTEAFLTLSQDDRSQFLNNETAFHNLLWYHIVPGTYYSEGLEDGQWLSTLHNVGRLRVELTRQNRKSKLEKINGEAKVIESDVSATNGVVHFIDRILTDILF